MKFEAFVLLKLEKSSLFENTKDINCKYHKINEQRFGGIDVTHLHYPLYNDFLGVRNIPHIMVVRNPYDKFYSCIRNMHEFHRINYNIILNSYEGFLDFVNREINIYSFHNNWFLPQNKFMSPNTYYWKYEWGFGKNFKKWIYEKTKIEIDLKKVEYQKFDGETEKKFDLNKRVKKYIKKYYKEDYKKFKYFWQTLKKLAH